MKRLLLFTLLCTAVHACSLSAVGQISDQQRSANPSYLVSTEQIVKALSVRGQENHNEVDIFRLLVTALQKSNVSYVPKLGAMLDCFLKVMKNQIEELKLERDFGRGVRRADYELLLKSLTLFTTFYYNGDFTEIERKFENMLKLELKELK